MSELKVIDVDKMADVRSLSGQFYRKYEVDEVIAKKDAKILALDAEVFKQKHHAELFLDERNYAETQLRHYKSEADKVISELKAQKAQAEDDCAYWKTKAQRERHHKYRRCLLYAKNHKNLGDLATDAARLIGLNAYKFTKETETACVAYWNRIRDCHYRHHDEWLVLAEKFKDKETR